MKKLIFVLLCVNFAILSTLFITNPTHVYSAELPGWNATHYVCTEYPPCGPDCVYLRQVCWPGGPYTICVSHDCIGTYKWEHYW